MVLLSIIEHLCFAVFGNLNFGGFDLGRMEIVTSIGELRGEFG